MTCPMLTDAVQQAMHASVDRSQAKRINIIKAFFLVLYYIYTPWNNAILIESIICTFQWIFQTLFKDLKRAPYYWYQPHCHLPPPPPNILINSPVMPIYTQSRCYKNYVSVVKRLLTGTIYVWFLCQFVFSNNVKTKQNRYKILILKDLRSITVVGGRQCKSKDYPS